MAEEGSPLLSQKQARLNDSARHISKSASELNGRECSIDDTSSPSGSPQRAKSAANPSVVGVIQKTHGFFNTLKNKWSRARSRERLGRKSPNDLLEHQESTDYAADCSSENNSPVNSPRHRAVTIGGSPLAREFKMSAETALENYNDLNSLTSDFDPVRPTNDGTQSALDLLAQEEIKRKKDSQLRQYVFFQLRVHLQCGRNLVAMDKRGTSDPYVKFKINGRLLHKSKTIHRDLNPKWDEVFVVPIEDPFQPIFMKVFDYDWGLQDDFMGSAKIDLTELELGTPKDLQIKLEDTSRPNGDLGEIIMSATLWPRSQEEKELHFQKDARLTETTKKFKSQIWSSVVTIILVRARDLPLTEDGSKLTDVCIKFRLGNEKYKTKGSYNSRWLEQIDMHLFEEEQTLEVSLYSRNTLYGRTAIDLSKFPHEKTHGMWQSFDDCDGDVFLLMTISGTTSSETISDLKAYAESISERNAILERYKISKSFQHLRDIGHLTVKVYGAHGLASADLGGKSDPFCVLELVNARLQTQTEYKTLAPSWNKIFTFNIKDITSVLEVTVYDEDRDHRVEFLGKVVIPLLRIKNGVKRWYTLKDKRLYRKAKGGNPQIQLEMSVVWNPIRAALRVIGRKEMKLMEPEIKFKRQIFFQNVSRLKSIGVQFLNKVQYVQSCFEWESPVRTTCAIIIWVFVCFFGTIEMIPLILLVIIMKNWFIRCVTGSDCIEDYEYDDEEEVDEKDDKKSIKERLQAIQDVSQSVQNIIGEIASIFERIVNTFNFSVPELTWLAVFFLILTYLILHFISIRIILLGLGVVKFGRRIFRPNVIPNNELIDFLSRVPNNPEMLSYREVSQQLLLKCNVKKKSKCC